MAKRKSTGKEPPKVQSKEAQRKREVERLDALEAAAWKSAKRYEDELCCDRFLGLILDVIRRRCELLGIDVPDHTSSGFGLGQ